DWLELGGGDGEAPAARVSKARGQREHVLGELGDVAPGARAGKGHAERCAGATVWVRVRAHLDARGADGVAQPRARPVPARFRRDERAGVALEKRDVRAEAADGHVD